MDKPSTLSTHQAFEAQALACHTSVRSLIAALYQMTSALEIGTLPPCELVDGFTTELSNLREKYQSLFDMTTEILDGEAVPSHGCSIADLEEAVRLQKRMLDKVRGEAEIILLSFLSVASDHKPYMEDILSFTEKASDLLRQLPCGHFIATQVQNVVVPYRLFIDALAMGDVDSEEKEALFRLIDEIYPVRVCRALYGGKYYIADAVQPDIDAKQTQSPHSENALALKLAQSHEACPLAPPQNSAVATDSSCVVACATPASEGGLKNEHDPAAFIPQEAAVEDSADEEVCLDEQEADATVNVTPNLCGMKLKNFVHGMLKGEYIILFQIFSSFSILTHEQAFEFGVLMGKFSEKNYSKVISALKMLVAKGCIKILSRPTAVLVMPKSHTDTVCEVAQGKRVQPFIMFNCRNSCPSMVSEAFITRSIAQNACLLRYLKRMKEAYPEHFMRACDSVILRAKSMHVAVLWENEEHSCQLAVDPQEICSKPQAWLFVPEDDKTLPLLSDLPEDSTCYAFAQGLVYIWEHGWRAEKERGPTVNLTSGVIGTGTTTRPVVTPPAEAPNDKPLFTDASSDDTPSEHLDDAFLRDAQQDNSKQVMPESAQGTFPVFAPEPIVDAANAEDDQDAIVPETVPVDEPLAVTAARLAERASCPSDIELKTLIIRLLGATPSIGEADTTKARIAQALMLAKSAQLLRRPASSALYEQLLLATGCDLDEVNYAGYHLNALFSRSVDEQSLMLATYMRALFSPLDGRDFALQEQAQMYLREYSQHFPAYPAIKPIFEKLCAIHDTEPCGFTTAVLAQLKNEEEKLSSMRELLERAKFCMGEPSIKAYLHGIPELCTNCFGKKSDLYACIEIITQNKQQDKDIVSTLLQEFYDLSGDTYILNEKNLENAIDSAWSEASKKQSTRRLTLGHMARKQIREAFLIRLDIMREWLESALPLNAERVSKLRRLKKAILHEINKLSEPYAECIDVAYYSVVQATINTIKQRLESHRVTEPLFADTLRTGFVQLDDRYLPLLDEAMCHVRYYEPWRRVLKHIALPDMTLAKAEKAISDPKDAYLFDNLHQQELIDKLQNRKDNTRSMLDKAEARAKKITDAFKGELELDYAAGHVTEQSKEDLLQLIENNWDDFRTTENFGCWKQFLEALTLQKKENFKKIQMQLLEAIDMRRKEAGSASSMLDQAERHLHDGQFTVAEEYINLHDQGSTEHTEELKIVLDEKDCFAHFLSEAIFNPLYDYCSNKNRQGREFSKVGIEYIQNNKPEGWTTRHLESSLKFIQNWPTARNKTKPQQIKEFLSALGFDVQQVKALPAHSDEVYELTVSPTPTGRTDYPHPIAVFGTRLKSPIVVVVLYGSRQAKELVDTINMLNPNKNGITLVLLDYALPLQTRRQVAEYCHQGSGLIPFLVIDRVLALHLAMHQDTDRQPTMLSCALPYAAGIQPFVRDGGRTSDEMFRGRTRELADILNLNGANLVYGGRQLGKTALLQRAQSRFHNPDTKHFAFFCIISKQNTEKDLVERLVTEINNESTLALKPCATLSAFCAQIEALFRQKRVQAMLLLLDEADDFLKSVSVDGYLPLQALVDLKRRQPDFKFVLAGLNNVYRAQNATKQNGIFGQLGQPLCIKPLSPVEALRLILHPLRYLGFKPAQDVQMETILSCTNYYPGILQFFGYTLAQSLNQNYTRSYRASEDAPPFILKNEHLGTIMNSDDLNESIKSKFRLSLAMDDRYFMLARCIGMLYHFQEPMHEVYKGYTVQTIRNLAEHDYHIICLSELTNGEYEALLDEMTEMGILHRSERSVYRLRKRSFLDIIGSDMNRLDNEIHIENEIHMKNDRSLQA